MQSGGSGRLAYTWPVLQKCTIVYLIAVLYLRQNDSGTGKCPDSPLCMREGGAGSKRLQSILGTVKIWMTLYVLHNWHILNPLPSPPLPPLPHTHTSLKVRWWGICVVTSALRCTPTWRLLSWVGSSLTWIEILWHRYRNNWRWTWTWTWRRIGCVCRSLVLISGQIWPRDI